MNNKILVALIGLLLVCLCLAVGGAGLIASQLPAMQTAFGLNVLPTPRAATGTVPSFPTVAARVTPAVVPSIALATTTTPLPAATNMPGDVLAQVTIPGRDLYQIVPRLRKDLTLATPVPVPTPRSHQVGDRDQFFIVEDMIGGKYRIAPAALQAVGAHSLWWVEDGFKIDLVALQKSVDVFEKTIYPTNLNYFGAVSPGPDGDTRVNVFNGKLDSGTAGYYGSGDTYPRRIFEYSNQRNVIFMNLNALKVNTNQYHADLAHEFQHLIHHYQAQHDTGWINEGMSGLAMKLNGYSTGDLNAFARNPDTQLNTWSGEPQANFPHYDASYLFFNYAAQRFGPEFSRAIVNAPREGVNGVQAVLDQRAGKISLDDLFADWAVTNILNDASIENGRYAYSNESAFRVARSPILSQYPVTRTANMREYAASYYTLQPANADVTIYFTGTVKAKLLPVDAQSGRWMWYSNRADLADMTLTRPFDLTGVKKATLLFSTWYDIEKDFDYAYVAVSTDDGKTWDTLPSNNTTTHNPNGANYGNAFTGKSGVSDPKAAAQWIQEKIDLSTYAGKKILLRFEYITDDAVNLPSWAIDDIAIPEINYSDNAENGDGGWRAAGFIRTDNVLPQRFIVQVIEQGATTRVQRVPLNRENLGNLTLQGFGKNISKAQLVITAYAPTTTEPTEFQIGIAPK